RKSRLCWNRHRSSVAMSLFQARDWWVTKAGDGEEYDVGSIVIGNIDNEPNNASKIVTGSLQGVLRVFYPKG
ncbi:unnamed protein product, partial [Heterosigma akashiwo]